MRDIDLGLDRGNGLPPPALSEAPEPPANGRETAVAASEVSEAHEVLLGSLDEVRRVAQLVAKQTEALASLLGPAETAVRSQAEKQERLVKETLSACEREWAGTAMRYRTL